MVIFYATMQSPGNTRMLGRRAHSLSGRLFCLTILFVMVSAALIYFPAAGLYHNALLTDRVHSAELVILPLTEMPSDDVSEDMRLELLSRAGIEAVILRGQGLHELFLIGPDEPPAIDTTYDLTSANMIADVRDAMRCLLAPAGRTVRIEAPTTLLPGTPRTISVVAREDAIRDALFAFSRQAILLSAALSVLTSLLVFASLHFGMVRPMKRFTAAMMRFRANPEDPSRILTPSGRSDEIGAAERELACMQRDIYGSLQQKTRLAALGMAVAKIQHDLRNILSSAQMASDRLAASADPGVKHVAARLMTALDRAAILASDVLRYGRTEERPPERTRFLLAPLVEEAAMAAIPEGSNVAFENAVPQSLGIDADREQMFRVLLNLLGNAREALETRRASGPERRISVNALPHGTRVTIVVRDNGPGLREAARESLFRPFAGTAKQGGSGLGLAIARELARAHGGDVTLLHSEPGDTRFAIEIPAGEAADADDGGRVLMAARR